MIDTDDITCLMIANEGERLIPIGRWEQPIKRLVASGHLYPNPDMFNCMITDKGRDAVREHEAYEDKALGSLIEKSSKMGFAQRQAATCIENAAKLVVEAVRVSAPQTGDSLEAAARKWLVVLAEDVKRQIVESQRS